MQQIREIARARKTRKNKIRNRLCFVSSRVYGKLREAALLGVMMSERRNLLLAYLLYFEHLMMKKNV